MEINIAGIFICFSFIFYIWILHIFVVWYEYNYGKKGWPLFLILGFVCYIIAYYLKRVMFSISLGILGTSLLWCIKEMFDQHVRVKRGWFPMNPKRINEYKSK